MLKSPPQPPAIDAETLAFVASLDAEQAASVLLVDREAARRHWDEWTPQERAEVFLRDARETKGTGKEKDIGEVAGEEEHVREDRKSVV